MSEKIKNLDGLPLALREMENQDISFVFNSWMTSYRGSKNLMSVAQPFYFNGQHKLIERLLMHSKSLLLVDKDNPSSIYSYIVYEIIDGIFVMHYAYTKQTFRKLGLFRRLLTAAGFQNTGLYTHESKVARYVGDKLNLFYNPYLLFGPSEPPKIETAKIPEEVLKEML
jgi:hypothetical protein